MIVCDELQLVLIQVPQTGSTSVGKELMTSYRGREIAGKHARLSDLEPTQLRAISGYALAIGVRDPLAMDLAKWRRAATFNAAEVADSRASAARARRAGVLDETSVAERPLVIGARLEAERWRPVTDSWTIERRRADFSLRQESLARDFERMITGLGAELVRPLPHRNKTRGAAIDPLFDLRWEQYTYAPLRRLHGYQTDTSALTKTERLVSSADFFTRHHTQSLFQRRGIAPDHAAARWTLRVIGAPFIPYHRTRPWRRGRS